VIRGDGGEVVGEVRTIVEQEDAEIRRFSITWADAVVREYCASTTSRAVTPLDNCRS
jgi:hypothetical protein